MRQKHSLNKTCLQMDSAKPLNVCHSTPIYQKHCNTPVMQYNIILLMSNMNSTGVTQCQQSLKFHKYYRT